MKHKLSHFGKVEIIGVHALTLFLKLSFSLNYLENFTRRKYLKIATALPVQTGLKMIPKKNILLYQFISECLNCIEKGIFSDEFATIQNCKLNQLDQI